MPAGLAHQRQAGTLLIPADIAEDDAARSPSAEWRPSRPAATDGSRRAPSSRYFSAILPITASLMNSTETCRYSLPGAWVTRSGARHQRHDAEDGRLAAERHQILGDHLGRAAGRSRSAAGAISRRSFFDGRQQRRLVLAIDGCRRHLALHAWRGWDGWPHPARRRGCGRSRNTSRR